MTRLTRFYIEVGEAPIPVKFNKDDMFLYRESFSKGELSRMLQFASDLYLGTAPVLGDYFHCISDVSEKSENSSKVC